MHRIAKAFGAAVQYSVFLCVLTRTDRARLSSAIAAAIDHKRDRVVVIDLGIHSDESWIPDIETFGRQDIARPRSHVIA